MDKILNADLSKTIQVDKIGIFRCACDDDGAVPGQVIFRLGKYSFLPCSRCMRQIEGVVMQAVLTTGATMAIEANLKRQEQKLESDKINQIKQELL